MFSNDMTDDGIKKLDSSYTSRVAEIFNVTLKSLGIDLDFIDEDEKIKILNNDEICNHTLNGKSYFCTDYQFYLIKKYEEIKEEILRENPVLMNNSLEEKIEEEMKNRSYIKKSLKDELNFDNK